MVTSVSSDDIRSPPVLRFTMRLLDARSLSEIAEVCANDLVGLFGCQRAVVRDDGREWARAEAEAEGDVRTVTMVFRLSGPEEPMVSVDVDIEAGPDVPIIRQQLLDLMGVARRAWRDRRQLVEARQSAQTDALTGLDNRRGLEEFLEHAVNEARHTREALTVMLVDLDHFKRVNDTLGHAAGDDVLRWAAECLRSHLRPRDHVCRWGGDEFLVVCPGLAAEPAARVAHRLKNAFGRDPRARGATMSIGVADNGAVRDPTAASLCEVADACLYEAKRAGRNQACQASSATSTVEQKFAG